MTGSFSPPTRAGHGKSRESRSGEASSRTASCRFSHSPAQCPESIRALVERYQAFMGSAVIRSFVERGGEVSVASEGRQVMHIAALAEAGQRHFAEKFVHEAEAKLAVLSDASGPQPIFHFYGALQSNKLHRILTVFDVVETVSSIPQAEKLAKRIRMHGAHLQGCMVQVNCGLEPQKQGVAPDQADALIEHCLAAALPLSGVMAIPPRATDPVPHFRALRKLADRFGLPHCQMGMSDDYVQAIDCGATHIRVGRAIFGPVSPRIRHA